MAILPLRGENSFFVYSLSAYSAFLVSLHSIRILRPEQLRFCCTHVAPYKKKP